MKKLVYVEPAEYFSKEMLAKAENKTVFKINEKEYQIKENNKSWTICFEEQKVSTKINLLKKDFNTLDEVKSWLASSDEYVTLCGGIKPVVLDKEWNEQIEKALED